MTIKWTEFTSWWTLHELKDVKARLYKMGHPRWTASIYPNGDELNLVHLDPTITQEEALAIVQTLAGAQRGI